MRTVITIENGLISVTIDDQQPVLVQPTIPVTPDTIKEQLNSEQAPPAFDCGYCQKRGSVCVRHGGERAGVYTAKKAQAPKTCPECGKTYTPYRVAQTFCSNECRLEAQRGDRLNQAKPIVPPAPKDENFTDPWSCEMCRNAQSLCRLHEGMEADGKKPPIYRHAE